MEFDGIDPSIAALLVETERKNTQSMRMPDLKNSSEAYEIENNEDSPNLQVDLTNTAFKKIEQNFSENPHAFFSDPNYYKKALAGEGDSSQRLHAILTKFLTCQDPKDRSVFRQQIVTIYWDFLRNVVQKIHQLPSNPAKKYILRFGLALPSLLTPEQKELFASVIDTNTYGEPIYYLDEWFRDIGLGRINVSATDEAKPSSRKTDNSYLIQLQNKAQGKIQSAESFLKAKVGERSMLEVELTSRVEDICHHEQQNGAAEYKAAYTDLQKRVMGDIGDKLKNLLKLDKELSSFFADLERAKEEDASITAKLNTVDMNSSVSSAEILGELETVRQMAKMTVGRQGNHFPILTREYYHCMNRDVGIRENVITQMTWIESVDPGAFCRLHKNQLNRIIPFVILIPTYGDTGFCWEPFDRYNRVTSRGRIVVPMYPKNLQTALLTAVADLRWQVAKEKASYYWMEEGLTGQYYQWYAAKKLKGDLKEFFIADYLLWMTKESEGVQRLDKEVRGIFWRNMPFPQSLKDTLKTRSLVYQELCQKDSNRAMSDGY